MGFSQIVNSWMILFPVIVILYYFFRKKYKRQVVSSTLFWEEAMQETKASPYLNKLQKNILLFLQIAALLFFVFTLMNPYIKSSTIAGEQVIIVVDTSASMLAGKEQTLFEQHKERLLNLIGQMQGKEVTLITTGKQPTVVLRSELSESAIRKAVDNLDITYEAAHIQNALDVAQSFIGNTATSVYVLTDALEKAAIPIVTENVLWHVFGQEEKLDNVAITKLAAMEQDGSKTILIQVKNDTELDQNVQIVIEDESKQSIDQVITVEKMSVKSHVISNAHVGNLLKASIIATDDYGVDNQAYTILQQPGATVQLDPEMHLLVQKGLASVYGDVVYFTSSNSEAFGKKDIIVTNKVEFLNGKQRVLLFGRNDAEATEVLQFADSSNHALFNFSPLSDVYVQAVYPPLEDAEVIATVGEHPFIQVSEKGDIIVLTDIALTDWAMHPVFPLFLWSSLQQLSTYNDTIGTFTPKQSSSIILPEKEWSIFDSQNRFVQTVESTRAFIAPSEPGIYSIEADGEAYPLIVDLSADERVIEQGESYEIGSIQVKESREQKNSIISWFIPIILLLLLIEWEVQRRRGFTN